MADEGRPIPPRITVLGLGPGRIEHLTEQAQAALLATSRRYLRTEHHPAAASLWERGMPYASYDGIYDSAESLDEAYARIVSALLAAAEEERDIVYAVPGTPSVGEETVRRLREAASRGEIRLEVVSGVSFIDAAFDALGVDPLAEGARIVDGRRIVEQVSGGGQPLLVAQVDARMFRQPAVSANRLDIQVVGRVIGQSGEIRRGEGHRLGRQADGARPERVGTIRR